MDDKKLKIALGIILGIAIIAVIVIASMLVTTLDTVAQGPVVTSIEQSKATTSAPKETTGITSKPSNDLQTDLIDETPMNIQPAKIIEANEGDIVDLENIKFVATYEDDTNILFNADELTFSSDIYKPLAAGINKITIMYKDGVYGFEINAKPTSKQKSNVELAKQKYKAEYETADHKHVSDSLFFTAKSYKNDKGGTYLIAHVVINDPSQMKINLAQDKFDNFRESPVENAKRNKWLIGINASAFSLETDHLMNTVYINNGKIMKDGTTTGNELCITKDGTMFTAEKGLSAKSLLDKNVLYTTYAETPSLIINGEPCDIAKYTNMNTKTAIGMVNKNEYYIVIASDGDYISDVSYQELQSIFVEKKCTYAKCMDGGANTFIVFNNNVINKAPVSKPRPVFDYITFYE